jgi:alkylation response protein AidB-like acyl-CoA dehydrogenase
VSDPFAAALDQVLAGACGPEVVAAAQGQWPATLWETIERSGLARVGVSEERGGAGAGWTEMASVIERAGAWAAPIPLAETIVARHLADRAGLDLPEGPISLAPGDEVTLDARGRLSGTLRRVPWGRESRAIVVALRHGDEVFARLDMPSGEVAEGENLAREPRTTIRLEHAAVEVVPARDGVGARRRGALARAAQISGALGRALELSVAHAGVREQFGRPIATFQAVQDLIARLAGEHAAVRAAVGAAARGGGPLEAVAAAKIRAGAGATEGARLAHQIHGAIGVTAEHRLHHFTTRLWSWRDEYGSEAYWARVLGARLSAGGGEGFWDWLVSSGTDAA